jgi:hypothetical protein
MIVPYDTVTDKDGNEVLYERVSNKEECRQHCKKFDLCGFWIYRPQPTVGICHLALENGHLKPSSRSAPGLEVFAGSKTCEDE